MNVLGLSKIEKLVEAKGFTTNRISIDRSAYTEIHFNNKIVGIIEATGNFPTVTFDKGCRKHAEKFLKDDDVIAPIKGIHRILDWHDVKKEKMHCLAGGQTVLHFKPFDFSVEYVGKFLKDTKLDSVIEKSKSQKVSI